IMSSVPYVPPDTMKNVAATRGQTVSFATFFLGEEIAREGNWAGREIVLNFLSRPPSAILALSLPREVERVRLLQLKDTKFHARCKRKCASGSKIFDARLPS